MPKNSNGRVLYQGPSMLDGKPIVVIATGLTRWSFNSKTGAMVQVYILLADVAPHVAAKLGLDVSICGDCRHKPTVDGSCYVDVWKDPNQIWKCWTTGSGYPDFHPDDLGLFQRRKVRVGSYGDPAAAPYAVWETILTVCDGNTGYTHQWRTCDPRLKLWLMASADTAEEKAEAEADGWRVFRVRTSAEDEPREANEFVCGASEDRGFVITCEACMACGGTMSKALASVTNTIHGSRAKKFRRTA